MTNWTEIANEAPPKDKIVLLYMRKAKLAGCCPYTVGFLTTEANKTYYAYCNMFNSAIKGELVYEPTHWTEFRHL